jgi:hypothetical protein
MALKYNSCVYSNLCDKCTTLYGELIHKYLIVMNQCPTKHINKDIRKKIWMFLKPNAMNFGRYSNWNWGLCEKHKNHDNTNTNIIDIFLNPSAMNFGQYSNWNWGLYEKHNNNYNTDIMDMFMK